MDDESRAKVEGIKNEMKVKEENKMYEELDQLEKYDQVLKENTQES